MKMRPVIRQIYDGNAGLSEETEEHFFTRIRLPNGVHKTTEAHRLDDLNQLVTGLLPEERPLKLMDVGISSGITTRDWSEHLTAAGVTHEIVAGDSHTDGEWLSFGWADLLFDRDHEDLLYADLFGFGVNISRDSMHSALVASVLKLLPRLSGLLHPEVRHVALVSPRLRDGQTITVVEDDIFNRRPEMTGRFHALRAANLLNRGYFDDHCLREAVANLQDRLRRDGLLIVCRTRPDGTNHGTVFQFTEGRWAAVARIGDGSEIEELVLSS
jgi:hypothetical protein